MHHITSFIVVFFIEVHYDLRLADGERENGGRLEVQVNGIWGSVCNVNWSSNHNNADVACRQLGYSRAFISYQMPIPGDDSLPIFLDKRNCTGSEHFLWECASAGIVVHNCRHWQDVFLVCSPDGNQLLYVYQYNSDPVSQRGFHFSKFESL